MAKQIQRHTAGEGFSIRPVRVEDTDALAALYAASFEDNPAYWSIFQEPRRVEHTASLIWLFQRRIALVLRSGAQYLCAVDSAGVPVAAGGLVRRSQQASLWDMVCVGLLEWPFRFGLPSLQRLLSMDDALGKDTDSDGTMVMVAVSPAHQGRGIGSALLTALLRGWDAAPHCSHGGRSALGETPPQQTDEPHYRGSISLNTQLPGAVRFYERHGFEQTREVTMRGADRESSSSQPAGGRNSRPARGAAGGGGAASHATVGGDDAAKGQAPAMAAAAAIGMGDDGRQQPRSWPPPSCYISRNMTRPSCRK